MQKVLYVLAGVFLALAATWAYTQDQRIEPWTVIVSGIMIIVGYFAKPNSEGSSTQTNIASGGNYV